MVDNEYLLVFVAFLLYFYFEVVRLEKESVSLEYKEKVTDTFLKTVSAFANSGSGTIVFGVEDRSLLVVGINNPKKAVDSIERKINDAVHPVPDYEVSIDTEKNLVSLSVFEGELKPYYYGQTAYIRRGASSIPMGELQLERILLKKRNLTYDQLTVPDKEFQFTILENEMKQKFGIERLGEDTQKSLRLLNVKNEYTIGAALLADCNDFPGIDIVEVNGENIYGEREKFENESVLKQLFDAVAMFRRFYMKEMVEQRIDGVQRREFFLIPEYAFREAVANALIHREWDLTSNIIIRFFDDRVEILSPGGLPEGITEDEFLYNEISRPRNLILSDIFFRLGYIESLGTGIQTIKKAYRDQFRQPEFEFTPNSIKVILPVLNQKPDFVSKDQELIYGLLKKNSYLSRKQISELTGFGRSKVTNLLAEMIERQLIQKSGTGRSIKYLLSGQDHKQ